MVSEKKLERRKDKLRRCIICMESRPKAELIRFIKNTDGKIFIDTTHKANGRGAYVMKEKCLNDAKLRVKLQAALKAKITEEDFNNLLNDIEKGEWPYV